MLNLRNSFPGQRDDESVFIFLRRHPVAYLGQVTVFGSIILVAIVLIIIIFYSEFLTGMRFNIAISCASIFLMASITFAYVALLDFYFDVHIVTDRRIVDIDQNRLFHRQIDELALEDIEDVSCTVKGFLGTFFTYGSVEIQTAGTKPNFIFDDVPNPREVSQLVLDLADQAKRGISVENRLSTSNIQGIIGTELIRDPDDMYSLGALTTEKTERIRHSSNKHRLAKNQ